MAFSPKTWVDGAGGGTPITAAELNRLEQAIADLSDVLDDIVERVETLETE